MNKLDHSGIHASRSLGRGLALLIGQAHEAPVRVSRPMSRSRGETIARCVEQLVAGGEALRAFDDAVRATREERGRLAAPAGL
ncbi:MAG: hypothetical protein K0Q43_121 [Ramlibacter sp.]|jgi:hypothetical protein|nr:hypothetical protein [Ramlibacter sp.]